MWPCSREADPPGPLAPKGCKPRALLRVLLAAYHAFLLGEEDGRDQSRLETKVWEAHNPLIDKQIDQFLVVAR